MRRAVIDIGTNTVLMLIAEVTDGKVNVISEYQEIPRLGRDVDRDGRLADESVLRVIKTLEKYQSIIQQLYPDISVPSVTATSAVRDASNRDQFIKKVEREMQWPVRILSGEEEADLTYSGALAVFNVSADKNYAVLDIGGGSTELAAGRGRELQRAVSLDLGSVRFSERYFKNNPPEKSQVQQAKEIIKSTISDIIFPEHTDILVGVAGTVTSIAGIEMNLKKYDPIKINGCSLEKSKIMKYIAEFSAIDSSDIEEKYPHFLKGRGDVIVAGLLILAEYMENLRVGTLTVSTGGIRYGVLMDPGL